MKSRSEELVKIVKNYLNQLGSELISVKIDPPVKNPVYYIKLFKSKYPEGETIETLLPQIYSILWILTYGKLDDENKLKKIDLEYEEVE